MSKSLKWVPKDPEGNVGVPGEGYIKASDYTKEHQDALLARAENRGVDEYEFMTKNKFVLSKNPALFEEEEAEDETSDEPKEEPVKKTRKKKAEPEAGE